MKRIAITGGIGAGKTAVTEYLHAMGWPVIDADVIARQIVEPGRRAWQAIRDAFGDAALQGDGTLDRAFLADVVFHDPAALTRLNHITHGYIGVEIFRELSGLEAEAAFLAIPLLRPDHRVAFELDAVWAIEVKTDTAVERLCTYRGFSEEDALARIAAQISNEKRAAMADVVIWNEGSLEELYAQVDEALNGAGLGRR